MIKRIIIVVLITITTVACGTKKAATGFERSNAKASGVIKNHYDKAVDFNTISGKLRATYQNSDRSQSVNLSFRMEKDKAIWMSASILGFPMAKVYITPEKVSYYEKVGKSYFDGDFSLVSKWLGTPLDFDKLQNLLIGQAIYDLRTDGYTLSESARGFQLLPKKESDVKKMFMLDSKTYKAKAQQLAQEDKNRSVTVTYDDYQTISGRIFPETITIIANESSESTNITIQYRSIEFDGDVSFPFSIPSGYDEISVK
ncbi:DUF4292 domain-containing protein [Zunongwangia endophytica]|uniref:DUF4292 domain-containing protein n=1 Tax=Zunongwangia endophytica TaxID=1808945 RepID=A0ABV8H3H2_9FLAO|nr:DUF4292 domain-containing protein [Zunongwangia endophytica]MDN3595873.1 DUF4292 domain-containing protein [Zunongwangia endophytica]